MSRAKAACGDWRTHDGYCQHHQRHEALMAQLPHLRAAAKDDGDLARVVREAEAARRRKEYEHLAGKISADDVTPYVDSELAAKVAHAKAIMLYEDVQAEREKVHAKLVATRRAAKAEAAEVLRQRYEAALTEVRDALLRAMAADQALDAVLRDAGQQFPGDRRTNGTRDEDGFNQVLGFQRSFPTIAAEPYVKDVDAALQRLKANG